jgi:hypothetical protein
VYQEKSGNPERFRFASDWIAHQKASALLDFRPSVIIARNAFARNGGVEKKKIPEPMHYCFQSFFNTYTKYTTVQPADLHYVPMSTSKFYNPISWCCVLFAIQITDRQNVDKMTENLTPPDHLRQG